MYILGMKGMVVYRGSRKDRRTGGIDRGKGEKKRGLEVKYRGDCRVKRTFYTEKEDHGMGIPRGGGTKEGRKKGQMICRKLTSNADPQVREMQCLDQPL